MRYINGWAVIETKNGKVIKFADGDDRSGGEWYLDGKDSLNDKETREWLFECIHKLRWRDYLAFKKDVGEDFIDWIEKSVQ